jgi:hypothetical protein
MHSSPNTDAVFRNRHAGFFITIIGLKIGEVTRVSQANWSIPTAVSEAQCFLKQSLADVLIPANTTVPLPMDIDFCKESVDLDFATYDLGMVNFKCVGACAVTWHDAACVAMTAC